MIIPNRDQIARELHEVFKAQPGGKQVAYDDLPPDTRQRGLMVAEWVVAKIIADRFERLAAAELRINELHRVNKEEIEKRRDFERLINGIKSGDISPDDIENHMTSLTAPTIRAIETAIIETAIKETARSRVV